MAVYVDDFFTPWRGMIMCHMVADSHEELVEFATQKLGLKAEWIQAEGTYREHFDVSKTVRQRAIRLGAKTITRRELVELCRARRTALERHYL